MVQRRRDRPGGVLAGARSGARAADRIHDCVGSCRRGRRAHRSDHCQQCGRSSRGRVRHELRSPASGRTHIVDAVFEVPAGGTAGIGTELRIPEPQLWSDADPHLYQLTTTLNWNGASAEYDEIVGIRTFAFDPDHGFSINGEERTLKGVCLHEDAGCFGVAVPPSVWLRRLLTLKEMGANAVRMAHNPHDRALYALCDALGLFVIDEAFDEWENPKNKWWQGHNVYPPRHEGYATHFPAWHERDLRDQIAAHRNHPSIIAWSIGNEVDYPNDPYASVLFEQMTGNNDADKPAQERMYDPTRPDVRRLTTIARRLSAIVREADPTRPVTLAAAFPELSSRTGLLDDLDLIGYNYKERLYPDDHRRFPDQPLIGSENGHGYAQWRAVAENDFVAGQFLWTGIDYLGEARGWPVHGSDAGMLTLAGFTKSEWHLRRSWWTQAPTAHLAVRAQPAGLDRKSFWTHPVSRNWDGAEEPIEVLCFAGGGAPHLTCDGSPVPLSFDEEGGFWSATVPASTAMFVLEVRDGDVVVARDELAHAGRPVVFAADVWHPPADAARRCRDAGIAIDSVIQIECRLLDAQGRLAAGELPVTVVTDGARVSIENGDLADITPYTSTMRRTFDGRLAVFVRAEDAGTVQVCAEGLPPVTVQL
ncbi:glycoside hydrolase family 2 TIM barrel-domain containing protein [Microbacterium suwonense]|uniref:glycoside hydrolase family 2 TIM barrel-domain containing protein n=1 Tax=Microbacterium suwonense TaxID=683047 RepID=UPI00257284D3|nr:glycoside hydrolase family 2 TIM barrel-domain containing protein [Microbacterium suwonense]